MSRAELEEIIDELERENGDLREEIYNLEYEIKSFKKKKEDWKDIMGTIYLGSIFTYFIYLMVFIFIAENIVPGILFEDLGVNVIESELIYYHSFIHSFWITPIVILIIINLYYIYQNREVIINFFLKLRENRLIKKE